MNSVPNTYKLISAHGGIEAPCNISEGNARFKVPDNILIVLLADFGSAITTKLSMNHPYRNMHYGFYRDLALIKSYFNNPLGKNIPDILKSAKIIEPGKYCQDMNLSMPPNPKHVNKTFKKFPEKDFEKGIFNLPLNINRAIKLRNAHKSNEPGAKNMSRFDILSNEYGNLAGEISFKLKEYVYKLSQRGGGYIFVDACRVVTGGGNNRYNYGNFTEYRNGLVTIKRRGGRGTMVNVSKNKNLQKRAIMEATESKKFKKRKLNEIGNTSVIQTHGGLRNLRSKEKRKKTNESAKQFIINSYGGVTAPSWINRRNYLKSMNLNSSRYRI